MGLGDIIGGKKVVGGGKIICTKNDSVRLFPVEEFSNYGVELKFNFNSTLSYVNNNVSAYDEDNGISALTIDLAWHHISGRSTGNQGILIGKLPDRLIYISYFLRAIGTPENHVLEFDYIGLAGAVT